MLYLMIILYLILYYVILHFIIILVYYITFIMLYHMIFHYVILYFIILYYIIIHYVILYFIILYLTQPLELEPSLQQPVRWHWEIPSRTLLYPQVWYTYYTNLWLLFYLETTKHDKPTILQPFLWLAVRGNIIMTRVKAQERERIESYSR